MAINGFSGALIIFSTLTSAPVDVGSGGSNFVVSSKLEGKSFSSTNLVKQNKKISESKNQNIQLSQQIKLIKDTFSLNDEELSDILNVERKTLHNWKVSNNIPRDKARQKFFELYILAQDWKSMGFPSERMKLDTHIFDEKSVLNTLPSLNKNELFFMGRHLLRQLDDIELL